VFAPNLRAPIADIKAEVEKATGLRVEIDNVANACALSEVWFGEIDGMHDLVAVHVDEGLGTGIIANGKLLRGESGMAGEFGHVQIEPSGPLCGCGNCGCWETTASNRAGLRYYHEIAPKGGVSTFDALLRLALNNDAAANEALERMALYLGRGLRMIASSLDPREIIVVGDFTSVWHKFSHIVEAEVHRNCISRPPVIRPSYEGNSARLRSAVALVLNEGSV
jgi:predicted NBD/HSP70 family sugar kinase